MMTSWSSINCGGEGIRLKVVNPDGTSCLTSPKNMRKGETLLWAAKQDLDGDCLSMVISEDSSLYIQSSTGDDFCPEYVWITTEEGHVYKTSKISAWHDRDKTNSVKHELKKSSSQPGRM